MNVQEFVDNLQSFIDQNEKYYDYSVVYTNQGSYIEAIGLISQKTGIELNIWNSEDDCRKLTETEEYEDFGVMIERVLNDYVEDLKGQLTMIKKFNKKNGKT